MTLLALLLPQDIPRSQEHAPSKTFYTFRANTADACSQLQNNTVQALLNLRIRMHQELAQEEEVRCTKHSTHLWLIRKGRLQRLHLAIGVPDRRPS